MLAARYLALIIFVLPCAWPPTIQAQSQLAGAPADPLIGTWVVTVAGEPVTRTLVISEVATAETGALLSAKYGLSTGKPGPIEAKLTKAGDKRVLLLTTQAATQISATEQADGTYRGTFTLKNGSVKEVAITKAGVHPPALVADPKEPTATMPLAADTEPRCAAFHGSWRGTWAQGGAGEAALKVIEAVSSPKGCTLRLTYGSAKSPITVELAGSTLSFVCNRATNGVCEFKLVGADLWASYSNPIGGTNSAVFKKMASP